MARPSTPRPRPRQPEATRTADIEIADPSVLLQLTGAGGANLRVLERELGVGAGLRGATVRLQGTDVAVAQAERVLAELLEVLESGAEIGEREVVRATRTLEHHPDASLKRLADDVVVIGGKGRPVRPLGVAQQEYVQAIRDHDVVFGVGPAGTGKTYLAMAMAVRALTQRAVKRIILTRPAVEAGEKLGFLPGDLAEKVNPYLRPLYDALHDMMDMDKAQGFLGRGIIEVAPLAFMRGRTLNDSFVILDEAQNTTPEQMKMFLTRLGFDSKAVITGDVTQVDLPEGRPSGLLDAVNLLGRVDGIVVRRFTDADVVRHPLVQRIVRAYDDRDARRQAAREGEGRPRRGGPSTPEGGSGSRATGVDAGDGVDDASVLGASAEEPRFEGDDG